MFRRNVLFFHSTLEEKLKNKAFWWRWDNGWNVCWGLISDLSLWACYWEGRQDILAEILPFEGRLKVKNSDTGDVEIALPLDCNLAQGDPLSTVMVVTGAHAVSMECPSLDIPVAAYARTFGNPWRPLLCYTASDSKAAQMGKTWDQRKQHFSHI